MFSTYVILFFFFFNDTATTEIYTLSLHDALPIRRAEEHDPRRAVGPCVAHRGRSEEHTSELQSRENLVCSLLLEKKKKQLYHPEYLYKHKMKLINHADYHDT